MIFTLTDLSNYYYTLDGFTTMEKAENWENVLGGFIVEGWPYGAPGEAWNYWMRPFVVGKYSTDEFYSLLDNS